MKVSCTGRCCVVHTHFLGFSKPEVHCQELWRLQKCRIRRFEADWYRLHFKKFAIRTLEGWPNGQTLYGELLQEF